MRLDEDDVATLHQQLTWLTKREGFIQRRLSQVGIVDEVLRGSLEDSFERLRHRFVSAIHTLPVEQADLLLDVFALTPETENITELMTRREFHGAKLGRGVDTVRTREAAALKALHSRLVTGRYAQAPLVLDVPEMHGGLIYEETSTLIVVEDRRWQATYEHYTFVNMAGELDYVTIGRSYPGTVTPSSTGAFKVNSRDVDGAGWNDHFWHLNTDRTAVEPMQDQERFDLRFRITPPEDGSEPTPMTLGSRALHHRSLLFTLRIGFVGEHPCSIWKFEGASPYARPHTANEYNRVQLDTKSTATMTLRDVHGGLFNGFAWNWDA
ncbi:hypothetical protein KPL76_09235 [Subtercola sp. PAMC28395]|uniref:hypothetical protein n=1 Tax=Subtercola sp. PAMC28395 TaxID=2846775 RepID=UPI001C0DF22B|nr:hypothetical protein [Subtercola sp. PAMC28395]QWT22963.1 hypothetical protein KPL76_09235 [Subtercola sp. PAMC28395]